MKEYAFGIDLGGTTAKVGLFTTSGALLEKWEVPTDTSNAGEHILENLADAIHAKMAEKEITSEQVEGVGIGVPGPVLDSRVVPIICANLGGWGERNVSAQLSGLLDGMKVLVGNDANVAALGEIWMGTAKGCRSAVMVTLGTGVGGGVLRDVLSNQKPYIFVKHFYACPTLIGALLCALCWRHLGDIPSMLLGAAVILVLRLCAAHFRWGLPHAADLPE
mgnify:CR=1 FL=1